MVEPGRPVCMPGRSLAAGDDFRGPAIVEQYDTTTYVPDGFEVHVDPWLNLIGDKIQ